VEDQRVARFDRRRCGHLAPTVRALALGIAVAVLVFALSGGHFLFLPLLFFPIGLFSFGLRRSRRGGLVRRRRTFWF
jgi:ABC-type uncharacterized transport system permease subunit